VDSSTHWNIVDSENVTDGSASENVSGGLTDPGTSSWVAGELEDSADSTDAITLAADEFTEIEFAIQATTSATNGGDYCFRLYDTTNTSVLDTYSVYAEVSLAGAPSAALTGTLADDATEAQIVSGGQTLIITLTNDTWDATIGDNNSKTTDLINGIDSGSSEGTGWDAVVKANMDYNDVTRTSDTVVTITLGAEATYDITSNETITVTVPATAVAGGSPIVATPTFDITTVAAGVTLDQTHYRWRNDDGAESGGGNATTQVSATADDTTSSTTYTQVDSMTITPGAGDYIVWFSGTLECDTAPTFQYVSLFLDDSQIAHTERQIETEGSIPDTDFTAVTHAYISGVTAGQAINVRWYTSDGASVATMHKRTLTVTKVTAADVSQVTATANDTTSNTAYTQINSMTTPALAAGDYLAWFSGSIAANTSATGTEQYVSLFVDTTQVSHTERLVDQEDSLGDTYFPVASHAKLTVTAGQTINVRWKVDAATTTATMPERTLTVYKINGADATQASATADTTTTSSTWGQVDSMAITPGAGSYNVWFTGSIEGTNAGSVQQVALYVNGVQVAHTIRDFLVEGSLTDTLQSFPVALHAYVTGVGAAEVIDVQWRTTAGTATMHERTLVVQAASDPGATWAADEDTKLADLTKSTTKRLRFLVDNSGTASSGAVSYELQVAEQDTAACASGSYTAVDVSTHWNIVDSSYVTDGDPSENVSGGLTDPGGSSWVAGELEDSLDSTDTITLGANEFTEIEFALQATASATDGGDYCFKLVEAGSGDLDSYSAYGQVSLAGPDLTQGHYRWRNDDGGEVATNGTIGVSGSVSVGTDDSVNSVTVSHTTPVGANRLMLVGISWNCDGNERVSSVFYGSQDMGTAYGTAYEDDDACIAIYKLVAPTEGTDNVVVTLDGTLLADHDIIVGVMTFTGVDQTTPLGTFYSEIGNNSGPATVTVADSAADDLVFSVFGCEDDCRAIAVDDETERWNEDPGPTAHPSALSQSELGGGSTELATGSNTQMSWTLTATDHWALGGVAIKPVSGGGDPAATFDLAEDTMLVGLTKGVANQQRVRFLVSNEGSLDSGNIAYELQVADTYQCATGTYEAVSTNSDWAIAASDNIAAGGADATEDIDPGLTNEASTFVDGELRDDSDTTGNIALSPDEFTEIEFSVYAETTAPDGQNYCFRLYDSTNDRPLDVYSEYAQVSLAWTTAVKLLRFEAKGGRDVRRCGAVV
jgi:hypothetical protein